MTVWERVGQLPEDHALPTSLMSIQMPTKVLDAVREPEGSVARFFVKRETWSMRGEDGGLKGCLSIWLAF